MSHSKDCPRNRPQTGRREKLGPRFDDIESEIVQLPSVLPIFPLSGAILLPGCHLPLNIFEPRYVTMVRHALDGDGFIGMIQPQELSVDRMDARGPDMHPELYTTGGAGKIGNYRETDDGRILIELRGVSRFEIDRELDVTTPYRQIIPRWDNFPDDQQMMLAAHDFEETDPDFTKRDALLAALKRFLELKGLAANFDTIAQAPDMMLVNGLCMIVQ